MNGHKIVNQNGFRLHLLCNRIANSLIIGSQLQTATIRVKVKG
jgi:hypothetical protein